MLSRSLLLSLSVILFQTTQLRADTYTVINTADSGAGSFRQAILDANGHANGAAPDVIGFAIPGSGVQVIQPPSLSLPAISDPVLIDGYLQPGASANTLAVGNNAVLLINLDGSIAGQSSALGINIQTSNCTVRGLIISRWAGAGVAIGSSAGAVRGNRILGNLIGTDATGAAASSNTHGVYIASGAAGNFVGSPAAADRNLISGNSIGVLIRDAFSESNSIQNNYLGSDKSGAAALLNGADIELQGVAFTVIGGTAPGAGNVIVGGSGNGAIIELNNSGGGATIQGNFIGTNAAGSAMLGRGGVSISTLNNLIGGSVPEARNVIGGGVEIREATATNNVIQGNYIGTNAAGTAALGNGTGDAIFLLRAGSTTVKNNVLVGSGGVNIAGNGGGAAVNVVQGNYIGTNAAGSAHLPPSLSAGGGVFIQSSNNHIIGGPGAGEGNVISGFSRGVHINGGSNNLVQGNRIGTDATGTAAIPNDVGITIVNTAFSGTTATQNQIVGNVISGNGSVGVNISGADENMIQGNLIGVDATNSAALPNLSHGVQLDGANNTLIGGTASGAGNVIAFNGSSQTDPRANGVKIFSGLGNSILGNSIFGNFNRLGIDLSATNDGGLNVTQNDPGDGDTGPNNLQNFPVLTSVVTTSAVEQFSARVLRERSDRSVRPRRGPNLRRLNHDHDRLGRERLLQYHRSGNHWRTPCYCHRDRQIWKHLRVLRGDRPALEHRHTAPGPDRR
jgi:titin